MPALPRTALVRPGSVSLGGSVRQCRPTRPPRRSMRFRAEQHLRRQNDIRAVREEGHRIECRAFTVWWKKRQTAPTVGLPTHTLPRVCVIASTKAVGIAVRRNRAKRRLRDVFRHQQHQVPAACDLLLIARAPATVWPLPELEHKFADACRQMTSLAAKGNP